MDERGLFNLISETIDRMFLPKLPEKYEEKLNEVIARNLPKILITFAIFIFPYLCCGPVLMSLGPSEYLAQRLVPPLYPNAILVDRWRSGGPVSMWEVSTYQSDDTLESILAFYEENMPDFKNIHDRADDQPYFVNGHTDRGLLGWYASLAVGGGEYPSMGVSIYPDPKNASETVIQVRVDWPAQ
jgi:hypothetical protein